MTDKIEQTNKYGKVKMPAGYYSASPLPSTEELSEFYSSVYYQQSVPSTYQSSYSEDELEQKRLRVNLLLHAIAVQGATNGHFLEVGCGEGFLLDGATNAGYETQGIDFSIHGVKQFHPELTSKVLTGDALELLNDFIEQGKEINVCVLQNVLEHVIEPENLLRRIKPLLNKDSIVAISVPNDYSRLQEKIMQNELSKDEYWFNPPQHLHYFNIDSLRKFVSSLGFKVVDAFGDFPIELFLFHEGSNYALDRSKGKSAHNARIALDLLLAENGMEAYHSFCQALTGCGFGRNIIMLIQPE